MNYKFCKIYKDVYQYSVSGIYLGLIESVERGRKRDFLLHNLISGNVERISNGGNIYDFYEFFPGEYFLSSTDPLETYFFKEGNKVKLSFILHLQGYPTANSMLCLSENALQEPIFIIVDFLTLQIKETFTQHMFLGGRMCFNGKFIISSKKGLLAGFDLQTGTRLWQLDLSGKGKFTDIETGEVHQQKIQLLEVHEDMVVVFMGNGYLAAYRVQDGSLVWERVLECGHTYIKIANGQVNYLYPHGLGNRFSVYDLNTGNLLFEVPISDEIFQREHFFTKPSISGNYFLITGQYRRHIFFFNRQTAVLEFKVDLNPYTHESGIGFDNAPQLHGRHLYQLNNEGQLMVFEVD